MVPTDTLKKYIYTVKEESRQLRFTETISALNAIKNISEEKRLLEKLIYLIISVKKPTKEKGELTKREGQIFNLVGAGFKSKEIGVILNISEKTVSTHRKNIIKKMKLTGSGQLKSIAYRTIQNKLQNLDS